MIADVKRIRAAKEKQLISDLVKRNTSPNKAGSQSSQLINEKIKMLPKSGRLSRTSSNPYHNVVFKANHSPLTMVMQNTSQEFKTNFESSVGIKNFVSNGNGDYV